ncbi:nuclear pore complex protein Nup133-like [Actinia tenebrosa]|uniref:Nuclear pore complex protein Nup133-like n=1 Tax=Actinia tenebrosa TaxID=6105 RepID=A0A6P8HZZ4_ACTTE|nr:nuclear pore complex protein Nup133-like [Actinia tenebrosa]
MSSPWTKYPVNKSVGRNVDGTPTTPRQTLNYSSFLDSSMTGRSQGRSSVAGKLLEETPYHRVETFGLTIPVQIREALALKNKSSVLQYTNVKLHESGWAWLVSGRKLYVWRFIPSPGSKSLYCKELLLPPTNLYHSANLVTILPSTWGADINNPGSAAIMMVSPEGVVRYWPSLAHDSNSIEVNTELSGHPCHSLTPFQPCGCVLMTTTNELMLLMPSQKSIMIHPLKVSGGVFSILGRRVSSLIFGSQQAAEQTTTVHKVLVSDFTRDNSRMLYVLSSNQLAKWEIQLTSSNTIQEKLVYQCDCEAMFTKAASQGLHVSLETIDQLTVWCLDVCNTGEGIDILAAVALKGQVKTSLFYMFGTLDNNLSEAPQSLGSVNIIQFAEEYSPSHEDQLLSYKMLLPQHSSNAYIYSAQSIICVPAYRTDDIVNKIDFNSPGDGILGAGVMKDKALFFSRKHGILSVTVTEDALRQQTDLSFSRSRIQEPQASQSIVPDVSFSQDFTDGDSTTDQLTQFKAAFLQFCQQNINDAQNICDQLFTPDSSGLDSAVAALSEELINDYPASDPRWAESIPAGSVSTSSSLIILHQLEDKLKAHGFLVNFLKGVGLWDRLKTFKVRDQSFPTWCLLCEHAEKLNAAIALCRCHKMYQKIVDMVISVVVKKRGSTAPYKGLTDQDLFFREVSFIADIFEGFLEYEEEILKTPSTHGTHVETIAGINTLMQEMLQEAWSYRQENSSLYQVIPNEGDQNPELIFWTGTSGPSGMRNILLNQIQITVERGINGTEDQKMRSMLYQHLVSLADILLDGYVVQLESLRHDASKQDRYDEVNQKYEQDRRTAILPLVQLHQYSQATSLAEKYQDFGILIELCEARDDKDSLQYYSTQFKDQGFPDYLFKWYMDKGDRHKLMNQPAPQHENLGKFLSSHHHLSWLHDIHTKSFHKAYETLKNLADNEQTFLTRKKTLLSLSKLALQAADDVDINQDVTDQIEIINNEHDIILQQEALPMEVLHNINMTADTMNPLSPTDLIQLYVGDKNPHSNEFDFKKALDLLRHAENSGCDDIESLKRYIWCRAILKDDWLALKDIDPLSSARHTVFFKTVELAYSQGLSLQEFMPAMESLLESEDLKNAGLLDNPNFRYLLKAGYEQIERTTQDDTEMVV